MFVCDSVELREMLKSEDSDSVEDAYIGPDGNGDQNILLCLYNFRNLKRLTISGDADGSPGDLAVALPTLKKLETLEILWWKKTDGTAELATSLRHATSITTLRIKQLNWKTEDYLILLESIQFLSNLVCLEMGGVRFDRMNMDVIIGDCLRKLPELQTAILKDCHLSSDNGIKSLAESLPYLKKLETLDLKSNVIDKCPNLIDSIIRNLPTLKCLDLEDNLIEDADALSLIKGFSRLQNLEHVNLQDNTLSDHAICQIMDLVPYSPRMLTFKTGLNISMERKLKHFTGNLHKLPNLIRPPTYLSDDILARFNEVTKFPKQLLTLILLFGEGYLGIKDSTTNLVKPFFGVTVKMPLEIQMRICNLVYDSPNEFITMSGEVAKEAKEKYLDL